MINLEVKERTILGKKVKKLRKQGLIPAIIYGHNIKPEAVEVEKKSFEKIFKEVGESTIINLIFKDKKKSIKALIHDVQYHPLTDEIIHIDFYQIKEKEKVTVDVELKFVGESPAVKEKGGTLVHYLKKIKIEALPKDLIHEITIDISKLTDFHDSIRVKDLKLPPEIRILNDPEEIIVSIAEPKKEEEAPKVVEESVETKPEAKPESEK